MRPRFRPRFFGEGKADTVRSSGALLSSTLACGTATATIRPEAGVIEGDIQLTGQLVGRDNCYDPLTCTIDNRYHVSVTPDGVTETVKP